MRLNIKFGKERRKHLSVICHWLAVGFSGPVVVQLANNPEKIQVLQLIMALIIFVVFEIAALLAIKEEKEDK